jgi:hypothetical protein
MIPAEIACTDTYSFQYRFQKKRLSFDARYPDAPLRIKCQAVGIGSRAEFGHCFPAAQGAICRDSKAAQAPPEGFVDIQPFFGCINSVYSHVNYLIHCRNFGVNHAEGGQVTPKADKSAKSLVRRTGARLRAIP